MSSHFIRQAYQQNGYREPEPHRIARLRVGGLLGNPDYKKEIRINDEWTVYPDIFWHERDIELDGLSHNTTALKAAKDANRDKALAERGIKTTRLLVEDVNGRRLKSGRYFRLRDDEILAMVR